LCRLYRRSENSMKAVGYVRVSTQAQVKEGVSLDAQELKIREWAKFKDASSVAIFRDEGISGKRADNRPGLQAALDAVGKGDALVAYSISRLSRSIRDLLNLSERLAKQGANLVSLSENIDTTSAAGEMVFGVLAVLAQFERKLLGERLRTAFEYKRGKGEKTGGDVPFGYHAKDGRLYHDEKEQAAVALILKLRKGGKSLRDICRSLELAGHRRKGGSQKWCAIAVSRVIRGSGRNTFTKA